MDTKQGIWKAQWSVIGNLILSYRLTPFLMTLNLSCKRAKGHANTLIPPHFLPSEAPTLSDTRSYISHATMSAVKAAADALDPSNSSQNTLKIENVRQHFFVLSLLTDSV